MGNNKPKTIEEFFVEKYQKLEEENKVLEERQEKLLEINNNLGDERDEWKNKYNELVERLREDYRIRLESCSSINGITYYINIDGSWIWKNAQKEKYQYYKNVFNLKEEGEKDNEQ